MTRLRPNANHWLAILTLALLLALALSDGYRRDTLMIALSFAICAAANDYASGYAGIRSLGPIIPFGLGCYGYGVLLEHGMGFFVSLATMPLGVAAFGAVLCFALVNDRRDPAPWAVFGLAASIALEQVARSTTWLTGGSNGMLVPRYFGDGAHGFGFALLASILAIAALIWLRWCASGVRGAAILLAHFEPERLQVLGRRLDRNRAAAVARQWGVSAIAGICFAAVSGTVDPSVFGIGNNLTLLIACTLFGERSILGPAIAAFLIIALENAFGSIWSGWQTLVLGISLILVLIWRNRDTAGSAGRESRP